MVRGGATVGIIFQTMEVGRGLERDEIEFHRECGLAREWSVGNDLLAT